MLTQEFNIGKKIKELRKQKGLTLADITKLTGLSKTTVSDIENNKTKPNLTTIEKLSVAIDIKPLFLQEQLNINELTSANSEKYIRNENIKETNAKYNSEDEVEESIDSFTIKLVEELLKENIIKDPENIPQEIVDLILVKLKKDVEMRKRSVD